MCGIFGIITNKENTGKIIRQALEILEYRGYDSAGIAVINEKKLIIRKEKGKIKEINKNNFFDELQGRIGIGHTRWATHGKPNKINAHPHTDCKKEIAIVHNGIIENYEELKKELNNHEFKTQTDTEVIAHLIEEELKQNDFEASTKNTIKKLKGSYALAIIKNDEEKIIVAKKESPLIIGIKNDEIIISSDITAILSHTNKIINLEDDEIGILKPEGKYKIMNKEGKIIEKQVQTIQEEKNSITKGNHPHYMIKEIHEIPNKIRQQLQQQNQKIIQEISQEIINVEHVFLTAAGTAYNACLTMQYLLNQICNVDSKAIICSEFTQLQKFVPKNSLIIVVSQSGETADTIEAIKHAKKSNARIISILNKKHSTIEKLSNKTIYTSAGPEIAVASQKAYITQLVVINQIIKSIAKNKNTISQEKMEQYENSLQQLPIVCEKVLEQSQKINKVSKTIIQHENIFFLARGINTPVAMEASLKLKEISYIHSEAYPAGESKHGPIALVNKEFLVVPIIPNDENRTNMINNLMEMKARDAKIITINEKNDEQIIELSNESINIEIPKNFYNPLKIIPFTVATHLLAYYSSINKNIDPDKPRNLAKSVTVK